MTIPARKRYSGRSWPKRLPSKYGCNPFYMRDFPSEWGRNADADVRLARRREAAEAWRLENLNAPPLETQYDDFEDTRRSDDTDYCAELCWAEERGLLAPTPLRVPFLEAIK